MSRRRSKSGSRSRSNSEDSRKQGDFGYLFKNPGKNPETGIGHFTPDEVPKNVPYRHWKPLETPKELPKSRGAKVVPAAKNFLRKGRKGKEGGKKTRRKKTRGKKKRHRRTKKY